MSGIERETSEQHEAPPPGDGASRTRKTWLSLLRDARVIIRALPPESQRLAIISPSVFMLFEPVLHSQSEPLAAVARGGYNALLALLVFAALVAGYEVRTPVPPSASGWGRQLEVAIIPSAVGALLVANGVYLFGVASLACAATPVVSAVRLLVRREPPRWRVSPSRVAMAWVIAPVFLVAGIFWVADLVVFAREVDGQIVGLQEEEGGLLTKEAKSVLVAVGGSEPMELESESLYEAALAAGSSPLAVRARVMRFTPFIVSVDLQGQRFGTAWGSGAVTWVTLPVTFAGFASAILLDQWWLRKKHRARMSS